MNIRSLIRLAPPGRLLLAAMALTVMALEANGGVNVEYFFDKDPGVGKAISLPAATGIQKLTVPADNLPAGPHLFSVRAIGDDGKVSSTVSSPVYISDEMLYQQAEYFIDEDPGEGNAIAVAGAPARQLAFNVATDNLSTGAHTMNARVKGNDSKWTPIMTKPFVVIEPPKEYDMTLEYFFGPDPGLGAGTVLEADLGNNVFWLPTAELNAGAHLLSVRARDKQGRWSWTVVNPLYIVNPLTLTHAEYFVDEDPGKGKATEIALSSEGETSFSLPTQEMEEGEHRLTLRASDEEGNWYTLIESPFTVTVSHGGVSTTLLQHFSATRQGSQIVLRSSNVKPGSIVSIYSLDGKLLNSQAWTDPNSELTLKAPANVIVTVTDETHRTAQHIM